MPGNAEYILQRGWDVPYRECISKSINIAMESGESLLAKIFTDKFLKMIVEEKVAGYIDGVEVARLMCQDKIV